MHVCFSFFFLQEPEPRARKRSRVARVKKRTCGIQFPQPILNPVMAPSWKLNLNRADIVSRHKAKSTNRRKRDVGEVPGRAPTAKLE